MMYHYIIYHTRRLPWGSMTANAGDARDMGLTLGLGRSPGEGKGNMLQYSCLEDFTNRGARALGVAKSWT